MTTDIEDVFWGSLSTIFFLGMFIGFILAPLLVVFVIIWVITLNPYVALIAGGIAEGVYVWFVVRGT